MNLQCIGDEECFELSYRRHLNRGQHRSSILDEGEVGKSMKVKCLAVP